MKLEAIKDFIIIDGKLEPTIENIEMFKKIEKPSIYEVIRVIDEVPLFLEEHLERMRKSANLIDEKLTRDDEEIEEDIKKLILKNKVENLNVKLLLAHVEGMGNVFLTYFIKSFYPPQKYYRDGINTILFNHERENPNAKIQQSSFREEVAKELEKKNAFEALLMNKDGYITEGSRSNMFFVRDNKVYTAPKGDVLLGITRKYILQVCEELNIKIIEENIQVDDLEKLDGAFMSGTSVNVLPITTVDNIKLNSINNKVVREINKGYLNKMKDYIKKIL